MDISLTAKDPIITTCEALAAAQGEALTQTAGGEGIGRRTGRFARATVIQIGHQIEAFVDHPVTVVVFAITQLAPRLLGCAGILATILSIRIQIEIALKAPIQLAAQGLIADGDTVLVTAGMATA
tara:strand:- start:55 stop:429 length:375 start_codon:yes stop_codon:yes gene_type:complete